MKIKGSLFIFLYLLVCGNISLGMGQNLVSAEKCHTKKKNILNMNRCSFPLLKWEQINNSSAGQLSAIPIVTEVVFKKTDECGSWKDLNLEHSLNFISDEKIIDDDKPFNEKWEYTPREMTLTLDKKLGPNKEIKSIQKLMIIPFDKEDWDKKSFSIKCQVSIKASLNQFAVKTSAEARKILDKWDEQLKVVRNKIFIKKDVPKYQKIFDLLEKIFNEMSSGMENEGTMSIDDLMDVIQDVRSLGIKDSSLMLDKIQNKIKSSYTGLSLNKLISKDEYLFLKDMKNQMKILSEKDQGETIEDLELIEKSINEKRKEVMSFLSEWGSRDEESQKVMIRSLIEKEIQKKMASLLTVFSKHLNKIPSKNKEEIVHE